MERGSCVTSYIRISRSILKENVTRGRHEPVVCVEIAGNVSYCMEAEIDGPSRVVYRPDEPRIGGARVWIETDAPIHMIGAKA